MQLQLFVTLRVWIAGSDKLSAMETDANMPVAEATTFLKYAAADVSCEIWELTVGNCLSMRELILHSLEQTAPDLRQVHWKLPKMCFSIQKMPPTVSQGYIEISI